LVIPLEEMNLIVDPKNRKLVGAHGDEVMIKKAWGLFPNTRLY